jgi:hypothetical protein
MSNIAGFTAQENAIVIPHHFLSVLERAVTPYNNGTLLVRADLDRAQLKPHKVQTFTFYHDITISWNYWRALWGDYLIKTGALQAKPLRVV